MYRIEHRYRPFDMCDNSMQCRFGGIHIRKVGLWVLLWKLLWYDWDRDRAVRGGDWIEMWIELEAGVDVLDRWYNWK
jgi:hypothetical protein